MNLLTEYAYLDVGAGSRPDRIFYEVRGDGEPLIFIHAGFVDRRMWNDQFEYFPEVGYRVVRYDVRGFGKSDFPSSEYSDYLDLKKLLDHLEIEKAVLIGVSNGGRIAFDFAVEFPDMVKALVLVNPGIKGYKSAGPEEDMLWNEVNQKYSYQESLLKVGKYRDATVVEVDIWDGRLEGESRERLIELARDNYHLMKKSPWDLQKSPKPYAFDRIQSIKMPTLFILGDCDVEASLTASKRIQRLIKASRLIMLENAGHLANVYNPDQFNKALKDFFETL